MVTYSKEEIAAAKKRGPEHHLSNKYNFAGPGTFYAERMKGSDYYEGLMKASGRKIVGTKPYNKPYDKVDSCGVPHDKVFNNPKATAKEVQKADAVFQQCALKAAQDTNIPDERLRGIFAAGGFELKKRLEDAGVLRKGSWARGGETRAEHIARASKKVVSKTTKDTVSAATSLAKKVIPGFSLGSKLMGALTKKGTKST